MSKTTRESLRALFSKAQKQEQTKSVKGFVDERFLKFNIGNTYTLRLLYYPVGDRTSPFIEQKVHRNYNPNLKKYTKVVCPSSPYLQGYEGYMNCPVCQASAKFYAKKQAGDKNAAAMYDTAKGITENYAVVYVVNDSSQGEDNCTGQIKIIKYGYDIQKILDMYVMGKEVKGAPALPEDEIVGFDAFDLENGRNLIISVAEKRVKTPTGTVKFPNYTASFSNKFSSVPLTEDDVAAAYEKLRFDKDFYVASDPKAINNFYKEFILRDDAALDIEDETEDESSEELSDDEDAEDEVFKSSNKAEDKPVKKSVSKKVEEDFEEDEDDEKDDDDLDMSFDEDDEDFEVPSKKSRKAEPVVEDDDEEEELRPKKSKSVSKKSKATKPVTDDDDWNMDFE